MDTTAADLNRLLGPLRRAALRTTRAEAGLPDMPEAHVEILRALAARSPQSPGELASSLRLARSTVSNLIKAMLAAGLITRAVDSADSRSTAISPSRKALDDLRRYDETGTQVLEHALTEFTGTERAELAGAVPLLERLAGILAGRPAAGDRHPD
jgi:DNA-binding MarR family transcriptional regulator